MSVEFDRRQLNSTVRATAGTAASGREDAQIAISLLGTKAGLEIPTATTLHFGQWLGWPDWMRDGTSLEGSGPLPRTVTLADDLIIIGNIIDNADGYALAQRILAAPRPIMGTTGVLSLLHAPDLGSALRTIVRAIAAQNLFLTIELEETDSHITISMSPPWPMGPLFQFSSMTGLALIYRAIEALACSDAGEMVLETRLCELPEAQAVLAGFQCQIRPSDGAERLSFPAGWQATANPDYDPQLWAVAQTKTAALQTLMGEPDDVAKVRIAIADMLAREHRVPRLKQISLALDISSRTMVRLLARHGTSFHGLVEQERRAKALLLIADCSISLAETARLLGFTDMSSFGRSFRNWFGETPGNVRKSWQSGSAARA
ncbi:helix-turn-helix transcriptional regulator [Blastomonas sp.]|uniref:helix-turn-helix transcriptional regulator n=1 Tax=Blastomonas sp. TaxID=1909299 RepID=UPI00262B3144|nr:helix-turn-helix transcriptional regulator [Blastomonas sp.]MDM7956075.1 helix-turn-helix transcriptional regulator [Blastomonas sp.]